MTGLNQENNSHSQGCQKAPHSFISSSSYFFTLVVLHKSRTNVLHVLPYSFTFYPNVSTQVFVTQSSLPQPRVCSFLLLQQTAVHSSILFLSHTVDRISQTCSVVKKSSPQDAAIQEVIAVSDIFKLCLTVIATSDECQGPQQFIAKGDACNLWQHIYWYHLLFQTGPLKSGMFCEVESNVKMTRCRLQGGDGEVGMAR